MATERWTKWLFSGIVAIAAAEYGDYDEWLDAQVCFYQMAFRCSKTTSSEGSSFLCRQKNWISFRFISSGATNRPWRWTGYWSCVRFWRWSSLSSPLPWLVVPCVVVPRHLTRSAQLTVDDKCALCALGDCSGPANNLKLSCGKQFRCGKLGKDSK